MALKDDDIDTGNTDPMTESLHELRALLEFERAARLEAERTGRLKDEFLEALGQELRAPFNSILGWSRLMELGRLDATETQSGGQTISRNARHLAHLVDDLLDLSAVPSGKIRVDPEETDICEIVEAALAAGAMGYVFKSRIETDLVRAVQSVARGQIFVSPNDTFRS